MTTSSSDALTVLSRGGVILPSSIGQIQYGAVPETIKDTLTTPAGVPGIFVVPRHFFARDRGVLMADLEFPAYWNFFVQGRRTTIVCRPDQRPIVERVFREACFGPAALDAHEFARRTDAVPDLAAEMNHFRFDPKLGRKTRIEDLIDLREVDENGRAALWDGVEVVHDDRALMVVEKGKVRHRYVGDPPMPSPRPVESAERKRFQRPRLGVSVIGSGHGFDPGNRTSGFLMWIDGRGVLVDPPVDAVDWLAGYDLSARDIDSLILTHCHADHDAGTLQKILQEERITIYTTPTVMSSFVDKYARLMQMKPNAFRKLFDHVPVLHGEPMTLHGAEVVFRYSFHSIPCIGMEVSFGGKSLVYPSDTLNDPETIVRLRDEGVLTQERARELASFPWHHELILHEAGVPPIHTPLKVLAGLDEAVKKRLYLVHVSARSLPDDAGLRVAPTGLENTIDLHASSGEAVDVLEALDVMSQVDILRGLPAERAAEFVRSVQRVRFPAGERMLAQGEVGEIMYIIVRGSAAVIKDGQALKTYAAYDYVGETSVVTGNPRVADVYAQVDVDALALRGVDFRRLLRGTSVLKRLVHLAELRVMPSWELMGASPVLRALTSNQKTQLQTLMKPTTIAAGTQLEHDALLVASGIVEIQRQGNVVATLGAGELAADAHAIFASLHPTLSFRARTEVTGYRIAHDALRAFLHRSPGVAMRLAHALTGRA